MIKDLIQAIKKYRKYALGGIIIVALLFFASRALKLYDENSVLKGKYEAYRAFAREDMRQTRTIIAEQQKKINDLIAERQIFEANIKKKDEENKKLNLTLEELEKQRQQLTDKDEIIANLDSQVAAWKEKFSIAQSIIEEKDKIIFNLTEKYEAQVKITESYKLMYEDAVKVSQVAELRIKGLERDLRMSRFTGNLTKASTLILGGLALYIALK